MFLVHKRPPLSDFDRRVLAAYTAQASPGYRASTAAPGRSNVSSSRSRAGRVLYPLAVVVAAGLMAAACAGLTGFGSWYPQLALPWGPLVDLAIFCVSILALAAGATVAAMLLAKLAANIMTRPVMPPLPRIDLDRPEGGSPVDTEDQGSRP